MAVPAAVLAAGRIEEAGCGFCTWMGKREDRLQRQFEAIERALPGSGALRTLRSGRYRMLRIPLSVFLILGGLAGFLPILGFWMVPVGLLLLAIDIPVLQPCVSAAVIRVRRRVDIWQRRWRHWRAR